MLDFTDEQKTNIMNASILMMAAAKLLVNINSMTAATIFQQGDALLGMLQHDGVFIPCEMSEEDEDIIADILDKMGFEKEINEYASDNLDKVDEEIKYIEPTSPVDKKERKPRVKKEKTQDSSDKTKRGKKNKESSTISETLELN